MIRVAAVVTALALMSATATAADGDAEAGKTKSVTCAACHGADGNSVNPQWPSLAGQHPHYVVNQLKAFQKGTRENVLMTSQAMGLSEQDMADLGAFFASQTITPKEADAELVGLGERVYRGGNKETHVTACIACHGPRGIGNEPAGFASIHGQHAEYLVMQLQAFKASQRQSDLNQMMRNIAILMSDQEMRAVAAYMQGLRP